MTGHAGLIASAASHLPFWQRILTPVFGAIAATLIVKASQTYFHTGKSVDYVEAVRFHGGHIPFRATVWRTISSVFSIASGAAIGREGSMIQFAASGVAATGLYLRKLAALDRLVVLGTAAAVGAVYQAPLAAVFFAIEIVLGLKAVSKAAYIRVPVLFVAAGAGAWMSYLFLGKGPLFPAASGVQFAWCDFWPILVFAVMIGVLGPVYFSIIDGLRLLKKLPWAMVWSAVLVGIFSCFRPETWGNGDSGVLEVLSGKLSLPVAVAILILRLVATSACVGSGVIGGVFTPTVFAGSVFGFLYGSGMHVLFGHLATPVAYAVLGISCLLGSVTHAPLMAGLMAVELTGTWQSFPIVLLCSLLSFQTARIISPKSLYAVATPDPGKINE